MRKLKAGTTAICVKIKFEKVFEKPIDFCISSCYNVPDFPKIQGGGILL